MAKKLGAFLFFVTVIQATIPATDFSLAPLKDTAFISTGIALYTTSQLIDGIPGEQQPLDYINGIDSMFIYQYDNFLDLTGTSCAYISLLLPGAIGLLSWDDSSRWITYGALYGEAFLLTYSIKDIMKAGVARWRPYTYNSSIKDTDYGYYNSFPSGHTALSFMGATFLTSILMTDFPDSPWTGPLAISSYGFAVLTGSLRVASGEHFVSDVLAGAALGTFIGWLIPFAHQNKHPKIDNLVVTPSPGGLSIRLTF